MKISGCSLKVAPPPAPPLTAHCGGLQIMKMSFVFCPVVELILLCANLLSMKLSRCLAKQLFKCTSASADSITLPGTACNCRISGHVTRDTCDALYPVLAP